MAVQSQIHLWVVRRFRLSVVMTYPRLTSTSEFPLHYTGTNICTWFLHHVHTQMYRCTDVHTRSMNNSWNENSTRFTPISHFSNTKYKHNYYKRACWKEKQSPFAILSWMWRTWCHTTHREVKCQDLTSNWILKYSNIHNSHPSHHLSRTRAHKSHSHHLDIICISSIIRE